MDFMSLTQIMFNVFAGAVVGLLAMNAAVLVLRVSHHGDTAQRIIRLVDPVVSYLRLGGKSRDDMRHSRHA
ncbi:hypothetical protein [Sinorhizobium fredii]|uniref:hypothetical protein n=1 Tax=Rhizobium fredii TaxID=380 RepID=UPI003CE5A7BC